MSVDSVPDAKAGPMLKQACTSGKQLLSRFHGCLVGAVLGDCLGSPFEGSDCVTYDEVERISLNMGKSTRSSRHRFTDDTAMTRSLAASLIEHNGFNAKDMATRFTDEFFRDSARGYGYNVTTVFQAWKDETYDDVFQPAREQFQGSGSYGNGGAMRIAPVPLFGYNFTEAKLQELAEQTTLLTHTHPDALSGAILQSFAIHQALHETSEVLDTQKFLDGLIEKMNKVEDNSEGVSRRPKRPSEEEPHPYCFKLEKIKEFLTKDEADTRDVVYELGTDVSALGSVPTAVFAFLWCHKERKGLEKWSPFEQTIIHSISLGGDTDTIASMAGAIAGAYYGIEAIPWEWQSQCEGVADAKKYAEDILKIVQSNVTAEV
ncbi:poly(ADP-ribose) glycohydrolase ARH3 [Lingula anatina]|uniref:ADP-ribosylhydrolase ARH3 n=1 Tax=Lingula anatina TaxID=7574 RepID=A0A1S3I3T0_LINAN|nr:poly(ADP-ribose) glycohydrolase ARH3 [Lingula anatina]XP_013392920.1 poly(ADP-ribose) glycohydrolase ARH3 [Lingula anatina]XP_013392921.1 poly(ADP-ribose) glycohydrolase ARH3 [Lingula anatina]XP_013392923.1 poly(ADP-ribose) glycohydrolase ARH3 [Lingula anatina]|eukprot:XP_013392919.1 poly(ADP-ribose) glycohydrolase ARH3 [Lingula anatina]